MTVPPATRYPGVGPRAVATFVDAFVGLFVVTTPVALLVGRHATVHRDRSYHVAVGISGPGAFALWLLLVLAYYVLFEWLAGATPGKLLLGLRVRSLDGARLTLLDATIRNTLRVVDGFPYFLPYLVGAITIWSDESDRQRLGDRAAKTVVTYR